MPIRPGFSRANRRSFSSAPGAYTSSSSMNARCDPRARGIAFMRAVSPASPEQGLRGKDAACQGTERPSQPVCLRRDEAELVAPLPHLRRQQIAEGAAQDRLRLAAADQLVRREREAQLDEAMVEERHPRLQ